MINSQKGIKSIAIVLILSISLLLFASCDKPLDSNKVTTPDNLDKIDTEIAPEDSNSNYNEGDATNIVFASSSITVNGSGAKVQGNEVIVNSEGVFAIHGSSSNGSIIVDAGKGKEVQLVLCGVDLTNPNGCVVRVISGKKVTITIKEGTQNTLSDGSSYNIVDENSTVDGAIFSKTDLVINGSGILSLKGNNAHGIVSKDTLTIAGGVLDITSKSAGLCGKDALKISGAKIKINSGSDALRSDNDTDASLGYIFIKDGEFDLVSKNDGIQAYNIVSIEGGTFNIKTTSTLSTESSKAIKGGTTINITGGEFSINSKDDAIHSNGVITISGGNFTINSADDGIHADETLTINSGNIVITNSYEGLEATHIVINGGYVDVTSSDDGMNASGGNDANTGVGGRPGMDMFESTNGSIIISGGYVILHIEGDGVDANGSIEISGGVVLVDGPSRGGNGSLDYASTAKITGGVVVTLGTSDMAQNFTEATQGSVLAKLNSGTYSAGTVMSICDENGNVILAFTSTKSFSCLLFSAPELKQGKTYTFYKNATVNDLDKNGFAHNTTQTGGESCGSVTLSSLITGQGSQMGGGGFPGGRPPR